MAASSNKEAACNQVLEEHLQRQRVEDSCTINWQREEQTKMEEETERIRTDAKRAIDMNLQKHRHVAMQQKLLMESEAKDYLLRYRQNLDEQVEKDRKDMESQVSTAMQKETLASQNEVLANDRLTIAREVIAAQTAREKQVASDHLFFKELQREEKAQEEVKETARINRQREILDKQIEEETRREKYFQTKNKNKTNKNTGTIEKKSPDDNERTAAPVNLSLTFNPPLAFPGMTKLLDILVTATAFPKLPAFLKTPDSRLIQSW